VTERRPYWVQCRGKVDHVTRRAARRARRCYAFDSLLHVYRCPWCDGIHLGNNPAAVKNRPAEQLDPLNDLELAALVMPILGCSFESALRYIAAPTFEDRLVGQRDEVVATLELARVLDVTFDEAEARRSVAESTDG